MSLSWHWFVVLGTMLSFVAWLWLLYRNRHGSDQPIGHNFDGIEELDTPIPRWWLWWFAGSIAFSIGYLVYYPGLGNFEGTGGWTSEREHTQGTSSLSDKSDPLYERLAALSPDELFVDRRAQIVGRRVYLNHCATCHGPEGTGFPGFPDLTDDNWIWGGEFEAVHTTIAQGRRALMPAWGAALGDEGVHDVAHHVLALAGEDHDSAAAERGAARYATICIACHGPEGRGNPMLGAADLTQGGWVYGGSYEQVAETIRDGREGIMPAHLDVLGADKVRIVSGYVWGLQREN